MQYNNVRAGIHNTRKKGTKSCIPVYVNLYVVDVMVSIFCIDLAYIVQIALCAIMFCTEMNY